MEETKNDIETIKTEEIAPPIFVKKYLLDIKIRLLSHLQKEEDLEIQKSLRTQIKIVEEKEKEIENMSEEKQNEWYKNEIEKNKNVCNITLDEL